MRVFEKEKILNDLQEVQSELGNFKYLYSSKNAQALKDATHLCQEKVENIFNFINCIDNNSEVLSKISNIYELLFILGNVYIINDDDFSHTFNNIFIEISDIKKIIKDISVKYQIIFYVYNYEAFKEFYHIYLELSEYKMFEILIMPVAYYLTDKDNKKNIISEADKFDKELPISILEDFDFKKNRPDIIFCQSLFDDENDIVKKEYVYSPLIFKEYCNRLIFAPKMNKEYFSELDIKYFDYIFIQSEKTVSSYIKSGIPFERFIVLSEDNFDIRFNFLRILGH